MRVPLAPDCTPARLPERLPFLRSKVVTHLPLDIMPVSPRGADGARRKNKDTNRTDRERGRIFVSRRRYKTRKRLSECGRRRRKKKSGRNQGKRRKDRRRRKKSARRESGRADKTAACLNPPEERTGGQLREPWSTHQGPALELPRERNGSRTSCKGPETSSAPAVALRPTLRMWPK